jgi:hypothetical protein
MGFQGSKINPQRFDKGQIAFYIPMALMGVVMILPLIFVISSAFKPFNELFLYPPRIFVREPTLDNFSDLFNVDNYMTVFVHRRRRDHNSLAVSAEQPRRHRADRPFGVHHRVDGGLCAEQDEIQEQKVSV